LSVAWSCFLLDYRGVVGLRSHERKSAVHNKAVTIREIRRWAGAPRLLLKRGRNER